MPLPIILGGLAVLAGVTGVKKAYDEFLDGKFKIYNRNIQHIEIEQVEMDYELDSKGYYQPVYVFSSVIDGESAKLLIPAVK